MALLTACSHPRAARTERHPAGQPGPAEFPELIPNDAKLNAAVTKAMKKILKGMPAADAQAAVARFSHYLAFLGITAKDLKKSSAPVTPAPAAAAAAPIPAPPANDPGDDGEDGGNGVPSNLNVFARLVAGSSRFLECEDLTDWECLEKPPSPRPVVVMRQEVDSTLGAPVRAGSKLDMDVFFTEGWDKDPATVDTSKTVASHLAEKLSQDASGDLALAMYGIDDITGSMKPVYDAILAHLHRTGVKTRAVTDMTGLERGPQPWVFTYVEPQSDAAKAKWILGPSNSGTGVHVGFQYDGTPAFYQAMNAGINADDQSKARLEWPSANIMHNKYVVMTGGGGEHSVWTGTANISNHCMGTERNSNMSVYIRNDQIARAYLAEFEQMFNFDPAVSTPSKLVVSATGGAALPVGRFHHNKRPLTHRLFTFDDGTQARVHFAPTDDAEHRVILPMLLSARAGDEIRVSMFGGTGYELVRAFQFAAAQGANVRIVFDKRLGHGLTSWTRDAVLNLKMPNPYVTRVTRQGGSAPGKIEVRMSGWDGKNHYKAGTLTRKSASPEGHAETLIVGSQNWSSGGNDDNDENLLSIQNLDHDVEAARLFNREFDTRLWPASNEER